MMFPFLLGVLHPIVCLADNASNPNITFFEFVLVHLHPGASKEFCEVDHACPCMLPPPQQDISSTSNALQQDISSTSNEKRSSSHAKAGQRWPNLTTGPSLVQTWPKLSKPGQAQPNLSQVSQTWPNLAKLPPPKTPNKFKTIKFTNILGRTLDRNVGPTT